jgi:hypothetical protein
VTLADLLKVPYVAHGRAETGADCYGLTRLARKHLYGKSLAGDYTEINPMDKRGLTKALAKEAVAYRQCPIKDGAIAAAFQGKLCTHMAIAVTVDGRLMILETNAKETNAKGMPRIIHPEMFARGYAKVIYYDD